jgi:hypothetical protein
MIGFAREVVNGMIDPDYLGGGIRIRNDKPDVKARLAAASEAYNLKNHAKLMQNFQDFEQVHPEHKVVRFRRMWRAAARAVDVDFASVDLESLSPIFTDAFGEEGWGVLSKSLGVTTQIPDLPVSQLTPMGFRVNGRALLLRVADRVCEALAEREPPIRHVLILVLHARILWEITCGEGEDRGLWLALFRVAYEDLLVALPGVCGGACYESVPAAMTAIGASPTAFPGLHSNFTRFLCTQDIDAKARLGKTFAAHALAEAAEAAAEDDAEDTPSNLDDYVAQLLIEL